MTSRKQQSSLFGEFDELSMQMVKSSMMFVNKADILEKGATVQLHNCKESERLATFIDLFAGVGGFHIAAKQMGLECVFASEIDEPASAVYKSNHGLTPHGDITQIKADHIPDHDLLCAGFPCQPFSIIGNREGFEDTRGTLFFEIARILEAKRPTAFILENVKQLVTSNNGDVMQRILATLEGLGYTVDHKVLNALNYGLPQKRERVLIIGRIDTLYGFEWPKAHKRRKPLSEILERTPERRHFVSPRIHKARQEAHKSDIKPAIWHENKAGNISSHPFSCALRAGASYNYLLVDGERRLTPREMFRLQGFPDSFNLHEKDSQSRKQAGNAVPVPMIKAVLERLVDV